jgi:hypothetical protein
MPAGAPGRTAPSGLQEYGRNRNTSEVADQPKFGISADADAGPSEAPDALTLRGSRSTLTLKTAWRTTPPRQAHIRGAATDITGCSAFVPETIVTFDAPRRPVWHLICACTIPSRSSI